MLSVLTRRIPSNHFAASRGGTTVGFPSVVSLRLCSEGRFFGIVRTGSLFRLIRKDTRYLEPAFLDRMFTSNVVRRFVSFDGSVTYMVVRVNPDYGKKN